MSSPYLVSESRTVATDPQQLFDIVANPAMHPVIDGSGTVQELRAGAPTRLSLGATFGVDMKMGAKYKIKNKVVEFEEGRLIAWRHFNGHIWRYLFEPSGQYTTVTEQWDARRVRNRVLLRLAGFPKRNRRGIADTLERLDRLATSGSAEPVA